MLNLRMGSFFIRDYLIFVRYTMKPVNKTERLYEHYLKSRTVSTDSRNIQPGALFFALKGERFDGNKFAERALSEGAAIAIVDDPALKKIDRCLYVDDVLSSLQDLAMFYRSRMKARVIAITGSNGKTTTKELIHAVMNQKYSCSATAGNLNNHIGVPLTLLAIRDDDDFAIVEMGANHAGEIARLCRIADPDFGIITNVGKAHLEGFGSFQGVIDAKSELYRYLQSTGGPVFVNGRNDILVGASQNNACLFYGNQDNEVFGEVTQSSPALSIRCSIRKRELPMNTQLVGAYNLENILAAVAIGDHFGVGADQIRMAVESYAPENNRSQVMKTWKNTLILDAYNANPSSMEAAIVNFAGGDYDNKVVVLGEMLELGIESEKEHDRLIQLVKKQRFPKVYLVGKNFSDLDYEGLEYFESTVDLMEHFQKYAPKGHTILIKGSRGNRLEEVVKFL